MHGLWEDAFVSCEGPAGKSLADHLFKDNSWLEEDMDGQ